MISVLNFETQCIEIYDSKVRCRWSGERAKSIVASANFFLENVFGLLFSCWLAKTSQKVKKLIVLSKQMTTTVASSHCGMAFIISTRHRNSQRVKLRMQTCAESSRHTLQRNIRALHLLLALRTWWSSSRMTRNPQWRRERGFGVQQAGDCSEKSCRDIAERSQVFLLSAQGTGRRVLMLLHVLWWRRDVEASQTPLQGACKQISQVLPAVHYASNFKVDRRNFHCTVAQDMASKNSKSSEWIQIVNIHTNISKLKNLNYLQFSDWKRRYYWVNESKNTTSHRSPSWYNENSIHVARSKTRSFVRQTEKLEKHLP